ncbi:unnamed protein product [Linum tenue]|uniref:Uncharacterized protein n=1 Tax=Linum tenue TaxID=586396 RepID=A0AAV0MB53_9ROSI|nr:unnamed protein product [Linum tenue]
MALGNSGSTLSLSRYRFLSQKLGPLQCWPSSLLNPLPGRDTRSKYPVGYFGF